MSRKWCNAKLRDHHPEVLKKYSRRVVFFNATAIKDHLAAYSEALQYSIDSSKYNELSAVMHKHQTHEPTRVFTDMEIDAWVRMRTTEESNKQVNQRKGKRK